MTPKKGMIWDDGVRSLFHYTTSAAAVINTLTDIFPLIDK